MASLARSHASPYGSPTRPTLREEPEEPVAYHLSLIAGHRSRITTLDPGHHCHKDDLTGDMGRAFFRSEGFPLGPGAGPMFAPLAESLRCFCGSKLPLHWGKLGEKIVCNRTRTSGHQIPNKHLFIVGLEEMIVGPAEVSTISFGAKFQVRNWMVAVTFNAESFAGNISR